MAGVVTLRRGTAPVDPDEALVLAAQARPEAFGALYARFLPPVYRYLRTRCDSAEDASDLAQVVFIKAMTSLPRFRSGGAPFSAWLFRIARNAATDSHRRKRPSVDFDALPEVFAESPADAPEAEVVKHDRLHRLAALVAALDSDKRELLALRFAAGLTVPEIARVLGRRQGTVKKQLFRLIASLKEHYVEELN